MTAFLHPKHWCKNLLLSCLYYKSIFLKREEAKGKVTHRAPKTLERLTLKHFFVKINSINILNLKNNMTRPSREGGKSFPDTVGTKAPDSQVPELRFLELLRPLENEMREIEPGLKKQIDFYLTGVSRCEQDVYAQASPEDREKKKAALYFKLWQFFYSREERIKDIKSNEIRETIETKKRLFPCGIPKLVLCIDGRVLPKSYAGLHGNAIKTPAGDLADVVPSDKKEEPPYLMENSKFAHTLDKVLEEQDVVCEVLVSHDACTARRLETKDIKALEGNAPDDGLIDDVRRKKDIALAMKNYAKDKHPGKEIIPIQVSFDPHNGFSFMGLEKDECLEDERVTEKGFTHQVLEELAREGKIVSTEQLIDENDAFLRHIFEQSYFEIDYRNNYKESTVNFWKNIEKMVKNSEGESALETIKDKLKDIFPELKKKESQKELVQRALLLLANSYNAYLHNYDSSGGKKEYPYGKHDESVIVCSYSELGPFDRARGFSVYPDDPNLSTSINLAHGVVKDNRRAGVFSKSEKALLSTLYPGEEKPDKHVNNPVAELRFERLNELPDPAMVEKLRQTDWSELLSGKDNSGKNWMNMSSQEFFQWLDEKVKWIPSAVAHAINELRKGAVRAYEKGRPATKAHLDGRLALVSVLTGPKRETIAIFPFITRGYGKGQNE